MEHHDIAIAGVFFVRIWFHYYFKQTGQGGMSSALIKEMKLAQLKKAIEASDNGVPKSLS